VDAPQFKIAVSGCPLQLRVIDDKVSAWSWRRFGLRSFNVGRQWRPKGPANRPLCKVATEHKAMDFAPPSHPL